MTFKQSIRELKHVGTAHAAGDALRAMYAELLTGLHGGDGETAEKFYFPHLQKFATDKNVENEARELLRDRAASWDVIMGIRQ